MPAAGSMVRRFRGLCSDECIVHRVTKQNLTASMEEEPVLREGVVLKTDGAFGDGHNERVQMSFAVVQANDRSAIVTYAP